MSLTLDRNRPSLWTFPVSTSTEYRAETPPTRSVAKPEALTV